MAQVVKIDAYGHPQFVPGGLPGTDQDAPVQEAGQPAVDTQYANAWNNISNSQGSLGAMQSNPDLLNVTTNRPDQTVGERIVDQQSNFMYGGTATGAQDAIAGAQANMAPYTTGLGSMGQGFYGTSQAADAERQQGIGGMYGAANSLMGYAQQGPGDSVAQANLQANTAQAMRQQLAMAGSGRGAGGGAAAFRQAAGNQAQLAGQANAQAAMLGAQEAQDWRQAQLGAMQGAGALYGQGAGLGGEYALGAGQLATGATQGAGELQQGTENLAHQINMGQLQGDMGYEGNLTSIYGISKGIGSQQQLADKAAAQAREAGLWNAAASGAASLLEGDD